HVDVVDEAGCGIDFRINFGAVRRIIHFEAKLVDNLRIRLILDVEDLRHGKRCHACIASGFDPSFIKLSGPPFTLYYKITLSPDLNGNRHLLSRPVTQRHLGDKANPWIGYTRLNFTCIGNDESIVPLASLRDHSPGSTWIEGSADKVSAISVVAY